MQALSKKILIADDNEGIRDILSAYVKKEGFEAVTVKDGLEAVEAYQTGDFALVLLDVLMPQMDGFQVCKAIRQHGNIPIIMVTARGEDADRIMGLDIGADDYIVKPFSPGEVMARIRAVLRRIDIGEEEPKKELKLPGLEIDMASYRVTLYEKAVALTKKEIEILWLLASNPEKVFSRDNLLDSVWGYDYFGDARTVDTHVKRLRAKLDLPETAQWDIKTVWGVGYKLEVRYD